MVKVVRFSILMHMMILGSLKTHLFPKTRFLQFICTIYSIHSFIHSFIYSIHPWIHSLLIYSSIHPSIHSSIHFFINLFIRSFIHPFVRSFIHSFVLKLFSFTYPNIGMTIFHLQSHAGKVCLRSWYERNKHIFPASRWEPFDAEKKWDWTFF